MNYENIIVSTNGNVGVITINRPKVLNALSSAVMDEMSKALDNFEADDEIGAIVITGNEKSFAAGADISQMKDNTFAEAYLQNFITRNWERVTTCRKPTIAAVAGYALGGGCELAMMCDMIIAADNAQFGQPEINLGIIPGAGGTQRLTHAIGKSKSMDMCLTGRRMGAEEAERSGLASRVVPVDEMLDTAISIGQSIANQSRLAVVATKEAVNKSFETTLREGVLFERRMFHALFGTNDQKEGMTAFVEKRKPNWTHS